MLPRWPWLILLGLTIAGSSVPVSGATVASPLPTAEAGSDTPEALLAAAQLAMPADAAKAGKLAQASEAKIRQLPDSKARKLALATAQWLQGESLTRQNRAATAAPLIAVAIKSVDQVRPAIKLQGDLLQARARVESSQGQPQTALQDYQRAYTIFGKVGASRSQAVALQSIGLIYLEANDLEKVFYYYNLADETFPDDPMLKLSSINNRASALYALKRFKETEAEYHRAYAIALHVDNPALQIQILDNLARTQKLLGNLDAAEATLTQAIKLWRAGGETTALAPLLFETRAELAIERHRSADAVRFVEQALIAAGDAAVTRPYWQLQYTAYRAYAEAGDPAKALVHFEAFKQLDDQSRELAASTSAALIAARFDFANQNARIATLKAGQLERDIELDRLQTRQYFIVLGALLLIAVSVAVVLAFYLRSLRRSRDAIRAVNAQLTVVNAELNDALAVKSQFLATTSHEIRTPLNGVLGMTQVLLADPAVTGLVRERIALVHGAGEAMRALVDDILDFAKMGAGKLELHPLEADMPRLLDEVVDFWRDRAAQQDLTLTIDRTGAPERILVDSRRLRQILANLLSNAIKFTLAGSVELTVTTQPSATGERLRIAVTDTGIGIAESDHAAVFEKFRQLDGGTTRRFRGTGLGLAISQMLAQAMGGDVELVSAAGSGSTFTLDLPLVRAAASAPPADSRRAATLATARLVLVGASPIAQGVLRAVLAPRVGSFAVAADLPAVANAIAAGVTDLVLVDVPVPAASTSDGDMPVDLDELAATATAARGAGVDMAVLWPNLLATEHARLYAIGIDWVIGKPVTSSALVQRLQELFEGKSNSAERPDPAVTREFATT